MKTGSKGIALIKEFEGYHTRLPNGDCKAYLDKLVRPALYSRGYKGLWTIGYGCTEGVHEGLVWTEAQATAALMKEIAQTEREITDYIKVDLDQNQYDAVISLAYNLTGGLSKAQTLVKHINNKDWQKAADAFRLYSGAAQKKVPGLVRRREAERKLFLEWTKEDVAEQSTTVSTFRKWRNGFSITALIAMVMDAVGVGREYVDWLAQYSPPTKYVIAAGVIGLGFGITKYLQHKKFQEYEKGKYIPSEAEPLRGKEETV